MSMNSMVWYIIYLIRLTIMIIRYWYHGVIIIMINNQHLLGMRPALMVRSHSLLACHQYGSSW